MKRQELDSNNAGGSGSANTGWDCCTKMHLCRIRTFTNGKPLSFNETEVSWTETWFEKTEYVIEICKRAKEDKTLGLANAKIISPSNLKAMMTTEILPNKLKSTDGVKSFGTLTLKEMTSRHTTIPLFSRTGLMCPELLFQPKRKSLKSTFEVIPEGIILSIKDSIAIKGSGKISKGTTITSTKQREQEALRFMCAAQLSGRGYLGKLTMVQ
ncbi:hypothetical protein Tco_0126426 [Tanacetum coccineum]